MLEMNDKKITLLSSFADDYLYDQNGNRFGTQIGGPAFYITKVLEKEGLDYDLIQSDKFEVEIRLGQSGETGRILNEVKEVKVAFKDIQNPFILISTIGSEFSLEGIENYQGKVFLDVQGFTRIKGDFTKKSWKPDSLLSEKIFCLKATGKELSFLPADLIEKQKQKMLLITYGAAGSELYCLGEKYFKTPEEVPIKDTVGAGDTFFAYFISQSIKNNSPEDDLHYATEKTNQFLTKVI